MKIKVFQKGFNYSQDGPGNRLVYHLQGCNMRCPWCANPEGMDPAGVLMVQPDKLIEAVCPYGAVQGQTLNRALCETCAGRDCVATRRSLGLRLSCKEYETDALAEEAARSKALFYNGGGVTLTGGEATLQFEGTAELLGKFKAQGIHTALETNGSHPRLPELFPLLDLLIMDCKHHDEQKHREATGLPLTRVLQNLAAARQGGVPLLVRIPLIGGFNSAPQDAACFARLLAQCPGSSARYEFLAYHEYGRPKWEQCGYPYTMREGKIGGDTLDVFTKIFTEHHLCVTHT